MIEVERVNGSKVLVNPDLIKIIEVTPDTVITFTDGEKLLLRTPVDEIILKIIQYRKQFMLPEIRK